MMLNILVQFCEGVIVLIFGKFVCEEDYIFVYQLMFFVGYSFDVDEELMDVMIVLIGGGLVYLYMVIEVLVDGVVWVGLNC